MNCIKTGCTVLIKDKLYHGDLFLAGEELLLRGVPMHQSGKYYAYYTPDKHYDAICGSIEPLSVNERGYASFAFYEELMPTAPFYDFIVNWAPFALSYFRVRGH
jgi:hypothetical protein